jgi:hypothetical protein
MLQGGVPVQVLRNVFGAVLFSDVVQPPYQYEIYELCPPVTSSTGVS